MFVIQQYKNARIGDYIVTVDTVDKFKKLNEFVFLIRIFNIKTGSDYIEKKSPLKAFDLYFTKNKQDIDSQFEKLCQLLNGIKNLSTNNQSTPQIVSKKNKEVCVLCGNQMVLKSGKYGQFYGCTQFPKCKCIANKSGRLNPTTIEAAGLKVPKNYSAFKPNTDLFQTKPMLDDSIPLHKQATYSLADTLYPEESGSNTKPTSNEDNDSRLDNIEID